MCVNWPLVNSFPERLILKLVNGIGSFLNICSLFFNIFEHGEKGNNLKYNYPFFSSCHPGQFPQTVTCYFLESLKWLLPPSCFAIHAGFLKA